MAEEYKITLSQPYTYQSEEGRLINGYRVWFNILQFNETYYVDVPRFDVDTIRKAISPIVAGRKALG